MRLLLMLGVGLAGSEHFTVLLIAPGKRRSRHR